jgi:hypothetical protein
MFPLSGGVDCRTILSLLKDREGLTCMTWGIQPSLTDPSNDAYLARQIADHFHLPHRFFAADSVEEDFANVLDRFLIAGEGRVDHLTGYQDGFRLWRELYESGIQGVIRGDQGFCPKPISNEVEARHSVHLAMLDDFPELNAFSEAVQGYLGSQMFPENLQRTSDETLEAWRDRVRHTYGLGAVHGALNDLKATYVELANPLLSPRIIAVVRGLPDHLRRRKHVLRQIARRVGPPVPFARALATRDMGDFVASPAAAAVLAQELESPLMRELISDAAVDFLSEGLRDRPGPGQSQLRRAGRRIKGWLPTALKRKLRRAVGCRPPSRYVLALRACLISRMHQMLSEDARAGRNTTE